MSRPARRSRRSRRALRRCAPGSRPASRTRLPASSVSATYSASYVSAQPSWSATSQARRRSTASPRSLIGSRWMRARCSRATSASRSPRATASCSADSVCERRSVGASSSCSAETSIPSLARWRTAPQSTTNLVTRDTVPRLGWGRERQADRARARVLARRVGVGRGRFHVAWRRPRRHSGDAARPRVSRERPLFHHAFRSRRRHLRCRAGGGSSRRARRAQRVRVLGLRGERSYPRADRSDGLRRHRPGEGRAGSGLQGRRAALELGVDRAGREPRRAQRGAEGDVPPASRAGAWWHPARKRGAARTTRAATSRARSSARGSRPSSTRNPRRRGTPSSPASPS